MAYRLYEGRAMRILDPQISIRATKIAINKRESNHEILLGGWIRSIDLIKDISIDQQISITIIELRQLSNACSLQVSPCGSFIRSSNHKDEVECFSVEEDSIWFVPSSGWDWDSYSFCYGNRVDYLQVSDVVFEGMYYEVRGLELYKRIIPLMKTSESLLLPVPKQLVE